MAFWWGIGCKYSTSGAENFVSCHLQVRLTSYSSKLMDSLTICSIRFEHFTDQQDSIPKKIPETQTTPAMSDAPVQNIIKQDPENEKIPSYVEIPRQIHQPARFNSVFVTPPKIRPDPDLPFWQAANEHETPIWGWTVVNHANNGIQFFLKDGTFYREVRMNRRTGLDFPEWLPFDPPKRSEENKSWDVVQLARFVSTLVNKEGY